jgi:1-acyl-sn-glycerol-3-phosphate acyltransferase
VLAVGYSAYFWAMFALTSIVCFPVAVGLWVITAPFDRRRVVLHQFTCFWASLYTWLSPAWPLKVEDRHKMRRHTTYVVVANHQSLVDIFVMFRLFRPFKWVSKIETFWLPLIGWNMWLNGYIPLKRGDRESVLKKMETCRVHLRRGSSIVMFPEGTRSRDGRIKPFKTGAFELALELELPVLPVVIHGTANALPRKGVIIRGRHPLRLQVLDPVLPGAVAERTSAELAELVRGRIAAALELTRAPAR